MKISTSFLACDDLKSCISKLNLTDANYIHVDFIKGKFVTGKEIPFRKLKKIPKLTSKRLDVHLMTDKLDKYIPKFSYLNCEYITFHIEATSNIEKYIKLIHTYGIKCGIAINPDTKVSDIFPLLSDVDLVLVMRWEGMKTTGSREADNNRAYVAITRASDDLKIMYYNKRSVNGNADIMPPIVKNENLCTWYS